MSYYYTAFSGRTASSRWAERFRQLAMVLCCFASVGLCIPMARRDDSGGLWVRAGLAKSVVVDILATSGSPGVHYALVAGRGVYYSQDGGQSWNPLNQGLPLDGWGRVNAKTLVMSNDNPALLYLGMAGAGTWGNAENAGLYVSENGGASWRGLPRDMAGRDVQTIAMASLPGTRLATVCVGTADGIHCSGDEGQTWSRLGWRGVETRISSLAFQPGAPETLYVGTYRYGLYVSTDGGASWRELNGGWGELDVYDIEMSATQPNRLYIATSDGAYISEDAGVSWSRMGETLKDRTVLDLTCLENSATLLAGVLHGGAYWSTCGAEQWMPLGRGLGDLTVHSIVADPQNPSVLWAGTSDGVWRCVVDVHSRSDVAGTEPTAIPAVGPVSGSTPAEPPSPIPSASGLPTLTPSATMTPAPTLTLVPTRTPTASPTFTSTTLPEVRDTAVPTLVSTETAIPQSTPSLPPPPLPTPTREPTMAPTVPPPLTPTPTRVLR